MRVIVLVAFVLAPALLSGCTAKETTFEGRVFDRDSRQPLPGAQVEATLAGSTTTVTATTDGEGRYRLVAGPGTWKLEASAPRYESAEQSGLTLAERDRKEQDFYLARET